MKIGVQLYTIRDYCKDLTSFSESLKKTADIGYKYVQISGTCEYDATWLKEQLDRNGLACVITHTTPDRIQHETEKVTEEHKIFGCRNIGIGYFDIKNEGAEGFEKKFSSAAVKIKNSGYYLMYHNHANEFEKINGKTHLSLLAEMFPADTLGFTLDTYWAQAAGADPVEWINKLSGRTPCVHFKDMYYDRKMAPVGDGNMNFEGIIQACIKNKVGYALVEQDDCNGIDPFICLKQSRDYLRSLGLD
ncbi:MAG: sugar phosphate isomerase/epimerase [Eubacteriales bacterium]|nr:sugar phosphate isomerase/epimerase [Eubacteriales bacterium]